ncbi:AAA family ATPase [Pedobacter sp. HDW13]|uniref:ATP-dependent nuclease n=1 Tax=Pedobacter sp. HDW13 TaxID=2714940 RepID=UPI00140847E2|nr:AAA family ATPase [Pedobacter sp. HDW13]QIL38320.1 AAA family ATPase [Pedobacter sp. HDW13]
MKIESIRIENFRSFKDQTITLDDYTCFVGPNGAGKSTVFNALNIFFRQSKDSRTDLSKLVDSDFHHKNTNNEIKITVTFTELSDQAKADLSNYVRHDKLIVSAVAVYDPQTQRAEIKQYGNRLAMEDFKPFFDALKAGASVSDLQAIYLQLKEKYADLPKPGTKTAMTQSLNDFENANSKLCVLIPSEDQFYGITKGSNKLAPYIQWVFVSASKDASDEGEESKTSALGQLLARTVRSKVNFNERLTEMRLAAKAHYQQMLENEQGALNEISASLQKRLAAWSHPNITAKVLWKEDQEKSIRIDEPYAFIKIGERGFEAELARFGHGLQRSYMLALLQELALIDDTSAPTLIMGIEEPELYQHPPQARYLAETLIELSGKDSQLLVCTHNPLFIPGENFDKIRIVRENGNPSFTVISSLAYTKLAEELESVGEKLNKEMGMVAKLYPSLNPVMNEMFFCKVLVLVEGYEDIAYLTTYLILTGRLNDFRKYGCHIVPVEGKNNLIKPLTMAKLLSIPAFVIFDADTDKDQIEEEARRTNEVRLHKKENKTILAIQGVYDNNEWPDDHLFMQNTVCWKTNITNTIREEIGDDWKEHWNQACAFYGNAAGLHKNPLAVARCLESSWIKGLKSKSLERLVDVVIEFAKRGNE